MQHEVVAMVGEGEHQQCFQGGGKGDGIAHKGEASERKARSDSRHKQHGRCPFLHEIEHRMAARKGDIFDGERENAKEHGHQAAPHHAYHGQKSLAEQQRNEPWQRHHEPQQQGRKQQDASIDLPIDQQVEAFPGMAHAREAWKIVGLHGMKHHPGIGHGQHGGGIIEPHHVHIALPLQPPAHEKGHPIGHHPCGYEGQSQTKGGPTAAQHVFAERYLVAETPTAAAHNEQHLHARCNQKHGHNGVQPPLIEANG